MINVTSLQQTIEAQKRSINALQNEVHWYEGLIANPGFDEVDIRLMATNTPREIKMGLTGEAPERKIYYPALAAEAHTSEKTASRHLHKLKQMGAFSYRTVRDEETGNTRACLAPLPAIETPAQLEYDRAKRGGSTWEDGKRVKRCINPTCGSTNLVRVTHIVCADCGTLQGEKTYKPVNDPDSQIDTDLAQPE